MIKAYLLMVWIVGAIIIDVHLGASKQLENFVRTDAPEIARAMVCFTWPVWVPLRWLNLTYSDPPDVGEV